MILDPWGKLSADTPTLRRQEHPLSPQRAPRPDGFYDSADVAELLTAKLGRDISPRAVRDEWRIAASGRSTDARGRPTHGLPTPHRAGGVLLYPKDHVDQWLTAHPDETRSPLQRLTEQLRDALAEGSGRRLTLVRDAKRGGMSWATITAALNAVDGRNVSRQAVAKRYGPHI